MSQTGVRVSVLITEINTSSTTQQREAHRLAERILYLLDRPKYRARREHGHAGGVRFGRDKNGLVIIRYQQEEISVAMSHDKSNRLKSRANIARLSKKILASQLLLKSLGHQL